jgi:hypothetical protein
VPHDLDRAIGTTMTPSGRPAVPIDLRSATPQAAAAEMG